APSRRKWSSGSFKNVVFIALSPHEGRGWRRSEPQRRPQHGAVGVELQVGAALLVVDREVAEAGDGADVVREGVVEPGEDFPAELRADAEAADVGEPAGAEPLGDRGAGADADDRVPPVQ